MRYWLILYHHRHGVNHAVIASRTRLDEIAVTHYATRVWGYAPGDNPDFNEQWIEFDETHIERLL